MRSLLIVVASFVLVTSNLQAADGPDWLVKQQEADGRWEADGEIGPHATTALALLARLESRDVRARKAVRRGFAFLRRTQNDDGSFPRPKSGRQTRDHAIATLALVDAFGRGDRALEPHARRAVKRLLELRTDDGGWGPDPTRTEEIETTTWAVMALHAASLSGLEVDEAALDGARTLLSRFKMKTLRDAAMVALLRVLLRERVPAALVELLLSKPPAWAGRGRCDTLYWYFGSQALGRLGGRSARDWNKAILGVVPSDETRWKPAGGWATRAGPVVSSALTWFCVDRCAAMMRERTIRSGSSMSYFGRVPPNLRKPEDSPPPPDNGTPTPGPGDGGGGLPGGAPGGAPAPAPPAGGTPTRRPSTGGTHEPNDAPYGHVFYKHYGVNPFVDTEDDELSTFAMDVDTGSYAITRRYLTDGHMPDPDSVRVEEFVNAFPTSDPAPKEGTFRLVAEGMPSPFGRQRYHLLRLGVRAKDVAPAVRKSARLTFVVDTSGSMGMESRLGLVKRALGLLVSRLRKDDEVALVEYGSRGRVLLRHSSNHDKLVAAIGRLVADGSTNAEEGLKLGYREARRAFEKDATNRVILCSDGVANVGRTGPDSILASIGEAAREGIALTTIGFGMGNYNDTLMEQLADTGDGNYAYVDTMKEARRIFLDSLEGMLETVAKDAKIQVEFDPAVVSRWRLLGYENRRLKHEEFRKDDVDAGEVGAGHAVTALYELKLHRDADGDRLGTFRVRYQLPDEERVVEEAIPMKRALLEAKPSRQLRRCAAVAEFAELLRQSYWARKGSFERVRKYLEPLVEESDREPGLVELLDLVATTVKLTAASEREGREAARGR